MAADWPNGGGGRDVGDNGGRKRRQKGPATAAPQAERVAGRRLGRRRGWGVDSAAEGPMVWPTHAG